MNWSNLNHKFLKLQCWILSLVKINKARKRFCDYWHWHCWGFGLKCKYSCSPVTSSCSDAYTAFYLKVKASFPAVLIILHFNIWNMKTEVGVIDPFPECFIYSTKSRLQACFWVSDWVWIHRFTEIKNTHQW